MASDDGEPQDEQQHEQAAKKPPGTWTPMETLHLIDAYQQKWYALKRGQLRTSHWEEVAESLAARCAGQPDATGKSSVQCRHKVEKLRRKYRAERQLFLRKGPGSSRWPFFERMDNMERGPAAAAEAASGAIKTALPFADLELQKRFGVGRELQDHESAMSLDEDAEDSDQPPPKVFSNRKRRQHHHNHHQDALPDNDGSYSSLNRKHGLYEAPSAFNKRDDYRSPRVSEKPGSTGLRRQAEAAPFAELVSVIRSLGEGFLRMEQMKIQMQRETERFRADMELRRTEMILDSQKQIADLFTKALISSKKSKKPQSPED